jgi:hypothetical protein
MNLCALQCWFVTSPFWPLYRLGESPRGPGTSSLKGDVLNARPHYSCLCYSLYTLLVNIRVLTRRNLASNWSSVDEDLRAQVKTSRVSRRAQAWRAPARARVMWTRLKSTRLQGIEESYWFLHFIVTRHWLLNVPDNISASDSLLDEH